MKNENVKIGKLKFQLIVPDDSEDLPVMEIENETSAVFESVNGEQAIELRNLLDEYINQLSNS